MNTSRRFRMGITALSAAALVAAAVGPVAAVPVTAAASPVTTLTMPVRPAGLAVDAKGATYVAGFGAGITGNGTELSIFEPGSTTRNEARTLKGLHSPWDVALHPVTGEILVSNFTEGTVTVFDPDGPLDRTLVGVPGATGVGVTATGTILAASATDKKIYVFEGPGVTASRSIPTVEAPGGLAVDDRSGVVYAVFPYADSMAAFSVATGIILAAPMTGLVDPYDVALQPSSRLLFVSEWGAGTGTGVRAVGVGTKEFVPGEELTGLSGPWGVAVSPTTGAVSVTDLGPVPGQVHVFPPVGFSVTSVSPPNGPMTGGTPVTITGSNLGAVTAVSIGGVAATNVVAVSPTTVTAVTPAHPVGTADVTVAWGTSTAGLTTAFQYTAVAPNKVTGVWGQPGNGQVTVRWTPAALTGGVPITGSVVTPSPNGTPCSAPATAASCTVSGLTNGQPYRFTVTTTNAAGLTAVSDPSEPVIPAIATSLKVVKAKAATYRPKRRGSTTLIGAIKVPANAKRAIYRSCANDSTRTSKQLCTFTVYKSGKVKVRTKGARNVIITVRVQSVPRASAGPTFMASPVWERSWRVK